MKDNNGLQMHKKWFDEIFGKKLIETGDNYLYLRHPYTMLEIQNLMTLVEKLTGKPNPRLTEDSEKAIIWARANNISLTDAAMDLYAHGPNSNLEKITL